MVVGVKVGCTASMKRFSGGSFCDLAFKAGLSHSAIMLSTVGARRDEETFISGKVDRLILLSGGDAQPT